jgi:cell division transport system permease protein
MFTTNLGRVIKFGFQNFKRNAWLSVVTVLILSLAIFMVSLLVTVQIVGNKAIDTVLQKVDVTVFFTQNTSTDQLETISHQLDERDDVVSVNTITADQAYENFKRDNKDDPIILESLEALDLNPLGPAIVLKANKLDDYPEILKLFDTEAVRPLIQDKDRDFESKQLVIRRLSDFVGQLRKIGLILVSIFALIACLVMYNTIRITIYTHRDEIGIMKLVGASNSFVRAPFIVESMLYAVSASIVTALLYYPAVVLATPVINRFFEGYDFNLLIYIQGIIWTLILLQMGAAVLLSIISAALAVGRYVRV